MRLFGPYTEAEADRLSRGAMRELAREWVEGKGEPPGKQVGPGPRNPPDQGYCTHAVPVLPAVAPGLAYLPATDAIEALPAKGSVPRGATERDPSVIKQVDAAPIAT